MNQADSIRQATKLRRDLFMEVWPNHNIETEKASEDQDDYYVVEEDEEAGWPIGWLDNWPIRWDLSLY